MIRFTFDDTQQLEIDERKLSAWIKRVALLHSKFIGEITYIICSDSKILEINKQFLNHDYYTDIITFDNSHGNKIAGDILISIDTVNSNAQERNIDPRMELNRIIIHGILHLCGLDDKTNEQKLLMRQKEDQALAILMP